MRQKIIVIVGPTASGKSEYAVRLAKKINGEIISADSRQIYKNLDIGSGKVPGKWIHSAVRSEVLSEVGLPNCGSSASIIQRKVFMYKEVPHYCIDFVSPKKRFTVAEFKTCAERAITAIHRSGKIPVLAGGTGFYIRAVVDGISLPRVPPNEKLRRALEKKSADELFVMLAKKDPARAQTIEQKNKRRLIRALEIIAALGAVPPISGHPMSRDFEVNFIGIKRSPEELKKRIEKRIGKMLKQGLVRETKKLKASGLSWRRIYEFGFEYSLPALYLQKKISKDEMRKNLVKESFRYARRQMLWWKRDTRIRWKKV